MSFVKKVQILSNWNMKSFSFVQINKHVNFLLSWILSSFVMIGIGSSSWYPNPLPISPFCISSKFCYKYCMRHNKFILHHYYILFYNSYFDVNWHQMIIVEFHSVVVVLYFSWPLIILKIYHKILVYNPYYSPHFSQST